MSAAAGSAAAGSAIDAIERRAFEAWPAEEVAVADGWRLRATRGVTRRANSVWTLEATGTLPLDARIAQAEAWYRARGLPPAFQLAARAQPPGLDAALEQRGYRIEAPVSIQVTKARSIVASVAGAAGTAGEAQTDVTRALSEAWFDVSGRRGRFAAVADIYRELLVRIGPGARFALARVDGEPAAVGLGVVTRGWMGVFSMLTLPEARQRGAGRAVLRALAGAAVEEGVEDVYLQVERSNAAALALYAAASFRELYGYHYRVT